MPSWGPTAGARDPHIRPSDKIAAKIFENRNVFSIFLIPSLWLRFCRVICLGSKQILESAAFTSISVLSVDNPAYDEARDGAGPLEAGAMAGVAGFAARRGGSFLLWQQPQLQRSSFASTSAASVGDIRDDNSRSTSPDHPCASTTHRSVRAAQLELVVHLDRFKRANLDANLAAHANRDIDVEDRRVESAVCRCNPASCPCS